MSGGFSYSPAGAAGLAAGNKFHAQKPKDFGGKPKDIGNKPKGMTGKNEPKEIGGKPKDFGDKLEKCQGTHSTMTLPKTGGAKFPGEG